MFTGVSVKGPEGKKTIKRPSSRWEDNIMKGIFKNWDEGYVSD